MGSTQLKERFEEQLKGFIEQRKLTEFNLHRLDAVIAYIQQELDNLQAQDKEKQDAST